MVEPKLKDTVFRWTVYIVEMSFTSEFNEYTMCLSIVFLQSWITELSLHPQFMFNVVFIPHTSFMISSISHQAFVCLVFSEIISSGETDYLKQTQKTNENPPPPRSDMSSGCFWMFFSAVSWQGRMITSTFAALEITKSLSFHTIWDALTLMLDLIILSGRCRFNTFIRI